MISSHTVTSELIVVTNINFNITEAGLNPSPLDCYQTLRGIKTLNLRMDQHLKNSVIVANYLGQHSAIEKVIHPG